MPRKVIKGKQLREVPEDQEWERGKSMFAASSVVSLPPPGKARVMAEYLYERKDGILAIRFYNGICAEITLGETEVIRQFGVFVLVEMDSSVIDTLIWLANHEPPVASMH